MREDIKGAVRLRELNERVLFVAAMDAMPPLARTFFLGALIFDPFSSFSQPECRSHKQKKTLIYIK